MRNLLRTMTLVAMIGAGCGDDDPGLTWGDLALQLGQSYCGAYSGCGFDAHSGCADHVRWHLCEPDRSCDVELPAEAQVAMDICDERLMLSSADDCALLYYGFLPVECNPVFGFSPGPQS